MRYLFSQVYHFILPYVGFVIPYFISISLDPGLLDLVSNFISSLFTAVDLFSVLHKTLKCSCPTVVQMLVLGGVVESVFAIGEPSGSPESTRLVFHVSRGSLVCKM